MFAELSTLAKVSLGFKSLQNDFFYVNKPTISSFGIERKYLLPILMIRDIDGQTFEQTPSPSLWLFNCKDNQADLRGTGALKYISAMADRAAAEKKQTGKTLTIREALEAQGGGTWYAPKALPNRHNLWLRKAFNSVFSPFVFAKPALVDQRCNSVTPLEGIEWKELAAVLTSSLFAYSLEINGAASMGAGALEAPTTKLRSYPVLDIAKLKPTARQKLVSLAAEVWANEKPHDWAQAESCPGANLRALDQWILKTAGRSVDTDVLYKDIREVCLSRIAVAKDKIKKTKKKQTDNIGNVADSIARAVQPRMHLKNFPEDFAEGCDLNIDFNVDRRSLRSVEVERLLGSCDVRIIGADNRVIYEATHPSGVAEAIVRALLWGRSAFSVSSNAKDMDRALTEFLKWVQQIEKVIAVAIAESALGTGYEEVLRKEIYTQLAIHPLSGSPTLPASVNFVPQA